jgi:hypothetical protein
MFAMLTCMLLAEPAAAQNRACQGSQMGQGGLGTGFQLQTALPQQIAQLQAVLQQVQSGQITPPSNSSITSTQLQTVLQQRIAQLQALQQQMQVMQTSTPQLTQAQLQAFAARQTRGRR